MDKVTILSPEEWRSLSEEDQNKRFFCEFFYSSKTTYLHPIYGNDFFLIPSLFPLIHLDYSPEKRKERIRLYSLVRRDHSSSSSSSSKAKRRKALPTKTPTDRLESAKSHLQLSWVPSHIPCRDEEHRQIEQYLRSSIQQKGNGSPLYISGMPGTGKTATVREVIADLQSELSFSVRKGNA